MRKTFEYLYTIRAEDTIEIEDIGQCCIQAFNDLGYYWYLIIETELGRSTVKYMGPFHADDDLMNNFNKGFRFDYSITDYKESRLSNVIDTFINDPKKNISQVLLVDNEAAFDDLSKINFKEMR